MSGNGHMIEQQGIWYLGRSIFKDVSGDPVSFEKLADKPERVVVSIGPIDGLQSHR
jgi:hypothetical protein